MLQTQTETRQQLLQYLESGQLRDAVWLGQQAVSRWPRNGAALRLLAQAYRGAGREQDAKQAQDKAAALEKK
jgi:Tfp pilus assembly protein PilF